MWYGLIAFIIIFFFGRMTMRRLHARRCDQYLAPLGKVQNRLVQHFANTKNKKKDSNKNNNNNSVVETEASELDAITSSDKSTEEGIPLVTMQEMFTALSETASSSSSTSSSVALPLKTLTRYLSASPSVALSFGGQRVVWSRSPNLLRRVLLTHFRMFPGPPTKYVSLSSEYNGVAELSTYKATSINASVFLSAILEQMNLNHSLASSSTSASTYPNTNGRICTKLFNLADGEKFWDHVNWQGGFKPAQFPDIPGLLLRGMSTKRAVQYRSFKNGGNSIHAGSSTFSQTPKNKNGEERPLSVKDSSSASNEKLNKNMNSLSEMLVSEFLKDVVGGENFLKKLIEAADHDLFASGGKKTDLPSNIAQNMLLNNNASNTSSTSQNILLSGGFAAGMNATSFPLSFLLSSSSSSSSPLRQTFTSLVSGLEKVLEQHIIDLAEAEDVSTRKSIQVGESSICGLTVALGNCGSVSLHDRPGQTTVMKNADRWDALLRKTLCHKSAVVSTHLITYAFDILNIVLKEVLQLPGASSTMDFKKVKAQFTDENFVLEAYVREAMRLNPLVRQAVRAVESDDAQRAEVFGISGDLVKVLNTPDEIIALQNEAAEKKKKKNSVSTSASKKAEAEAQERKLDEIIASKLDASIRLTLNGMLQTPASACIVCDIYSMQRNAEVFSISSVNQPSDKFYPQRWSSGSAANSDVQQRGRMEANFAPLGFGAAAEASTRYLISLVSDLVEDNVNL